MFLRSIHRKKDGKDHRYFSIVENHRIASDKTVQRTVLYLGEINDQQQAAWRKTLSVFDEQEQEYANLSLFPDDREIPADAIDSLQAKLSGLELRCPRLFGNCWLACVLWQQLGLREFWDARLSGTRAGTACDSGHQQQEKDRPQKDDGRRSKALGNCLSSRDQHWMSLPIPEFQEGRI
jgi:hypothetical protein